MLKDFSKAMRYELARRELRMEKEFFSSMQISFVAEIPLQIVDKFHWKNNWLYSYFAFIRVQHSGETISRYFNTVLEAIVSLSSEIIQLPPINTSFQISSNPKFMPHFKVFLYCLCCFSFLFVLLLTYSFQDCIGAIDGTHVPPITISPSLQDPYRNRMGGLSQNVMVACDVRWPIFARCIS